MDSKANKFPTSSHPSPTETESLEAVSSTKEDAVERMKIRLIGIGFFGFMAVMMGLVIFHDMEQREIYDKKRAEWCSTHAEICAAQRAEEAERKRKAYISLLLLAS